MSENIITPVAGLKDILTQTFKFKRKKKNHIFQKDIKNCQPGAFAYEVSLRFGRVRKIKLCLIQTASLKRTVKSKNKKSILDLQIRER